MVITQHIDMTTAAKSHTTAGTEDGKFAGFAGFHDIKAETGRDFEEMGLVIMIDDLDVHDTVGGCCQRMNVLRGQK